MINFLVYASSSKGNLYTLNDGQTRLLLEPGLPVAKIKTALEYQLFGVSACLVSHCHLDHCQGAKQIMTSAIDLYALALDLSGHRLHIIEPLEQFRIGSWAILPFNAKHDVPCLSFLLRSDIGSKCLFLIDSLYCPYRFKGLTHIFLGVNYDEDILAANVARGIINPLLANRIMNTHMSLQTSLKFFEAQDLSQVQAIYVLHCSETNLDKAKAKNKIQEVTGKFVILS
jgi:phosphoribosyl 1,2-cyclic phosphodiesterase